LILPVGTIEDEDEIVFPIPEANEVVSAIEYLEFDIPCVTVPSE
jgi:hypothetical protein